MYQSKSPLLLAPSVTKRPPLCSRATPFELPLCSLLLLHAPDLLPEPTSRPPSSPIIAPLERLIAIWIRQLYAKVPLGVPFGILDRPRLAPSPGSLHGPNDRHRLLVARLALSGMNLRLHKPLLAPPFLFNFLPLFYIYSLSVLSILFFFVCFFLCIAALWL